MKRIIVDVVVLSVICHLSSGSCFAGHKKVGTTGMQFLKIAPGARPASMGGVYAGIADDVDALYFNPAGLCQIKNLEATFMHLEYFQGIRYEYLALAKTEPKIGSLGVGVTLLTVGKDIEERIEASDEPLSKFGASDIAVSLGYGRNVIKGLSAGLNLKYLQSKIDVPDKPESASGFAADLGVLYKTPIKLDVGLAGQNLGAITNAFDKEKDDLPVNIKLGLAYRLLEDNLTLGLDTNVPLDNNVNVAVGAEYQLKFAKDFAAAFRAGYRTGFDIGSGLGLGAGFAFRNYGLDFAWVPFGELGNAYRVSLLAKF